MKLRISAIEHLETYFVMAKSTAISSVENTINKLHIQYDFILCTDKTFIMIHKMKLMPFLLIHAIEKLKTDLVMKKNTAISSVANTINKLHIQYDFILCTDKTFIIIHKMKLMPFL